jgi:PKD repeat protein/photosystem II stability/assembly factor-like uncharacterized protein
MRSLFTLAVCFLAYLPFSFSQNPETPYAQVEDLSLPTWVQLMYQEDADLGTVVEAYRTYYATHPFVKNQHTQYYKRWVRQAARNLDGLATTQDPALRYELLQNRQQFLEKSQLLSAQRGPDSEWACIGPIDYDEEAAGRSYAPGAAHVYTVEQAATNSDVLYAGTATAGVWKSTNYGESWVLTTKDLLVNGVIALEIDHSDENIIYFGGGGTIFKSTDGGQSWLPTGDASFNATWHTVRDLVMAPDDTQALFACADDGFYRTEDAGITWTKVMGGSAQELEFHPTNPSIVYLVRHVGDHTEFHKSIDGGQSWSIKGNGWPGLTSAEGASFPAPVFGPNDFNYGAFNSNPQPGGGFSDFTIELRVKVDSWEGDPAILSNKDWSNGFNKGFVIAARDNGEGWKFNMGDGDSRIDLDGGIINDFNWHHLAVTWDADGTKAIYQDGELINSTNTVITDEMASGLLLALAQDGTLNYPNSFPGMISDVRIWNTVLDATTLSEWACSAPSPNHPNFSNLQHYWPLQEGGGNIVSDVINNNVGSLNGSLSWATGQELQCLDISLGVDEHQRRTEIAVSAAEPNAVYALASGAANGGSGLYGIYVSTDQGESWTFTCCGDQPAGPASVDNQNIMGYATNGSNDGGQYYYDVAFDVSPLDGDRVEACGIMRWTSADGGSSFVCPAAWSAPGNDAYIHADIHDLRFFANNDIWVACDGGIYLSTNDGLTFERRMTGIEGTDFWGFGTGFQDPDVMVGGTYHNSTLLKDNDVYINGWISTAIGGAGGDNVRGFGNPGKARQIYMDAGKRVLPGDRTVNFSDAPFAKEANASYIIGESCNMAFHPQSFETVYTGNGTGLWRSDNDGASAELLYDFGEKVTGVQIAPTDPNVLYAVTWPDWWGEKKAWRSEDGGLSWEQLTLPFTNSLWAPLQIAVDDQNPDVLWLVRTPQSGNYNNLNGQKVYRTTDGGQSWENLTTPTLDGEYITCILRQRGTDGGIYLGTRRAVYYRNNSMNDWALFNNGLPASTTVVRLVPNYREGMVRAGTNRSVYEVDFYEPSELQAQISVDQVYSFCTRDTIQFADISTVEEDGASWDWSFPGGIPATSTERTPKVVFPEAGTYSVTLTVTNANGSQTQTLEDLITVTAECDPEEIPGYALQTGGVNEDYAAADPLNIEVEELTISAWIKPNGIQNSWAGLVFMRGGNTGAVGFNFADNNELRYHWEDSNNWGWSSGLVVPENEWAHVALVVSPDAATIYLNGVPSTNAIPHTSKILDASLRLAADPNWQDRRFNGLMDEVCIWDRALSQDEIREQMHLVKYPADDPNLLVYYQFNREEGVATDRVGLLHMNLNGNTTRVVSTGPFGPGASHRQDIISSGIYNFDNTGVTLSFGSATPYPDGEVVATRIDLQPDQTPATEGNAPSYWVLHSFGNPTFAQAEWLNLEGIGQVDPGQVTDPTGIRLYRRPATADGDTWGDWLDEADAANPGAEGGATFSIGNGITEFGQLSVVNDFTPSSTIPQTGVNQVRIFPNLIQDGQTVQVEANTMQAFELELFDIRGQRVRLFKLTGPNHTLHLDRLAPGQYVYRTRIGQQETTGTLIKVR